MPVLLMSHSLGHGGGERQLALTALSLDRGRFTPHVACSQGGFWVEQLEKAGVPIFFIRSRSLLSVEVVKEIRRLRRYIREHGIRIVQTFDFSMNLLGMAAAYGLAGVASLSNLRCHMNLIPLKYRWLNHVAHRVSSAVVVNSGALLNHLVDGCRIKRNRIFVCYNGIDTNVFHPPAAAGSGRPGEQEKAVVVGSLCVLRPEKNLPLLLDAFAALAPAHSNLRLLIVGSGPEEQSLRAQAERLGITDRCRFQPSTSNVREFLWQMDIFVLTSFSEGLSNAIMEAMACGCCTIATEVGGNPELIAGGVTGMLFPSDNREALVACLSSALGDAGRRRALAAAGAARMRDGFSLNAAVERMQDIYDQVLLK